MEGDRFLLITVDQGKPSEWIVTSKPAHVASSIEALARCSEAERVAPNDEALRAAGLG